MFFYPLWSNLGFFQVWAWYPVSKLPLTLETTAAEPAYFTRLQRHVKCCGSFLTSSFDLFSICWMKPQPSPRRFWSESLAKIFLSAGKSFPKGGKKTREGGFVRQRSSHILLFRDWFFYPFLYIMNETTLLQEDFEQSLKPKYSCQLGNLLSSKAGKKTRQERVDLWYKGAPTSFLIRIFPWLFFLPLPLRHDRNHPSPWRL